MNPCHGEGIQSREADDSNSQPAGNHQAGACHVAVLGRKATAATHSAEGKHLAISASSAALQRSAAAYHSIVLSACLLLLRPSAFPDDQSCCILPRTCKWWSGIKGLTVSSLHGIKSEAGERQCTCAPQSPNHATKSTPLGRKVATPRSFHLCGSKH